MSAEDKQIDGNHYRKLKIQPMRYSMENCLDACQHTAIKYITRFRDKGGIADLDKAIHCIELLKQFESEKHDPIIKVSSPDKHVRGPRASSLPLPCWNTNYRNRNDALP